MAVRRGRPGHLRRDAADARPRRTRRLGRPAQHHAAYFSLAALATGLGEAIGSFSGVRVATAEGLGAARLYTVLAVVTAALLVVTTAVRLLRRARS